MLFYTCTLWPHQHTILLFLLLLLFFSPSFLPSLSLPPLSLLCLSLQILSTLATQPLQCLRPSEKVSVICLLIEDLLGSPALCREVDTKMEQISTLRREKWKINLKLKRCVGGRCVGGRCVGGRCVGGGEVLAVHGKHGP